MSGRLPRAVLFACTSNSVRSPMAAAIAHRRVGDLWRIESAGVDPREIDPFAVAVMAEHGLDLSASRPRSFSATDAARFDLVICLTPEAHSQALWALAGSQVEFWPVADPTIERDRGRPRDQILEAYRAVRDDIEARILAKFAG